MQFLAMAMARCDLPVPVPPTSTALRCWSMKPPAARSCTSVWLIGVPSNLNSDRLHSRLHVVVDAAPAGALEQREGPVVGIEHHLLGLARIDPHEQHAAVTEPNMGGLHDHRHATQQDDLVAPVE